MRKHRGFFKVKSRPKGPLPFHYVFILSLLLFTLFTMQGLWLVEKGIRPTLMAIAHTETQKIATQAINDAISNKIVDSMDIEDLMQIETDSNGQVTSVKFNSEMYNRVLSESTLRTQKYLKMVEEGTIEDLGLPEEIEQELETEHFTDEGIIHMIPLGQATNNALLAQLGPRVPVQFSAIGDVKSSMSEKIFESGINNTYIRVSVDIEVDVRVVIPFATDTAVVSTSVPVGMVFISGEVPQFYNEGDGNMPAPAIIQEQDLHESMESEEESEGHVDAEVEEELETPEEPLEIPATD
ncbi:sporulation protein YunB [Alteribacillus persepolensis]|uniref:Sporulation protein YunB n=1 Tax=Alteribacillus persepolensis TaxID=568899 RepID=A0A1G8DWP3_9BACI|nr:sporulation protein YunB [Alteribacillus persepolensis]SDH61998.1 sporulation protein YunB [Alteribacillus persepolensis]